MLENLKVMRKIYKNNIATPYSLESMVKAVISLEDPEAICLYLKANPDIPANYVAVLIDALILYNNPDNMSWFESILKISSKMPLSTQEAISSSLKDIKNKVDMHYAYHRGIEF